MRRVLLAVAASSLLLSTAAIADTARTNADLSRTWSHGDELPRDVFASLQLPELRHATIAQAEPAVAAPTISPTKSLLDSLLTPGGIAAIVTVLGAVLGLVMGPSAVRKRRLALGIYHAYQIVNDIDRERDDDTLDKPKEGLRALDDYFKAQGWRPLRPGEEQVAKLGFQSLHGEEKQRVKVQAEAQALAAEIAASPQ